MVNITFTKIDIKNFLSIGTASIDLKEQGFVLVNGLNNETNPPQSNGSGKSSIFDAIFWTLTGETIRGTTDVVNEKSSEKGTRCTLEFSEGDHLYKIIRTKSDPEYGNCCFVYEGEDLLSDQTKKSQEIIEKSIPVVSSPEVLGSISLLGQGLPYKFSSFTPIKRKELLEIMSGASSEIDKVKYKLSLEESNLSSQMNSLKSESLKNQGIISGLLTSIQTLQNLMSISREDIVEEITEKEDEVTKLCTEIDSLTLLRDQRKQDIDRFIVSQNEVSSLLSSYKSSLSTIDSQLTSLRSGSCPTCGRPYEGETYESQIKILEDKSVSFRKLISQLEAKLSGIISQLSSLNETVRNLDNSIVSCNFKKSDVSRQITDLNKQLKDSEQTENTITENEEKIKELNVKINKNNKELEDLKLTEDCIDYLKRSLSREFKGYVLEEVINLLSSKSEYYSNYLFAGHDRISITLTGNKIMIYLGNRSYENLSGGERQRVDLAVQFALRDILVTTSGFSCNLLVLDEAFDNLDAQGSDALIKLLISEFSDIDSVFIVTHHSEIDIPYDQQVTVTKDSSGISSVRLS